MDPVPRRRLPSLAPLKPLLLAAVLAAERGSQADTYVVTESSGTGTGSLAWAIGKVNGNPTSDNRITFETSVTASSQFVIFGNVQMDGAGRTLDMGNNDRALLILGGSVTISNLTILNAHARGGGWGRWRRRSGWMSCPLPTSGAGNGKRVAMTVDRPA